MIPTDDHPPPDISLSDHCSQQKSHDFKISCDEKAHASVSDIDLFADLDANENPQSSFSLRDYVFNSRSKNIACNWPFSHKTLQICLQHEVKNILPPFQSLESVRNSSPTEEIISTCNEKSNPDLTLEFRKSKKLHLQQDLGQTKSKKPVLGFARKPETETATAMASKICPVCKVFASSSNTTLNAHIDQCLSGESTMMWTANPEVIVKHRIKPRKMRLMVDIYRTAPHCTVEELDERNGTSWANNSSFPDQEIEFEATTIVDHEGDVYSDNNRTKVRILSVPKANNNTYNDGSQNKGGKSGKVFLWKRKNKNHDRKHDHKYSKQSPNSKKSSSEVTVGPEETVGSGESCNKEVMTKDDLPIVRPPWACSKRTSLAKKNSTVAGDKPFPKPGFKPASSSSNKRGISSQENSPKMGSLTPNKEHFAKKRSLLLTKPSSKHLKKRGTILHSSCEEPPDSCLVNRSHVRSKGSKNWLSVSRKTASKINLKRKFSALKRCQDSLKQKSWVKEDTSGKISCECVNLLEVKTNEKMETCGPENSVSSRSLNEDSSRLKTCIADPSCDIESVRNETRSNKEQVSAMQVSGSSDNMFDSRERVIGVTDDHDMSDSPISTISNPSLARSDSDKFSVRSTPKKDEKYALVNFNSLGDWRSKGQSQTTSFKNDHQPCCCSRKEIASTYHDQSTLLRKHDVESFNFRPQMFSISKFPPPPPPSIKLPPYRKCDSAASPSKPVIRLMGKNLTVVNTDEDKVNCGQFPNVHNRCNFPSFSYQNGFKSQHSTFHPPNSLKNHALDTMFQSTTYADYYIHGSPHVGPMIPANQD